MKLFEDYYQEGKRRAHQPEHETMTDSTREWILRGATEAMLNDLTTEIEKLKSLTKKS